MRPWWERWPDRLQQERDAFVASGFEMELDEELFSAGRVVFRGRCAMRGRVVDLVVNYPDDFPATRFDASSESLSLPRHQSPGGTLCLLGRGSDQWRREWTAAEVLADQLPDLIDTIHASADAMRAVEDPQGEPYSTYYAYAGNGSILVPDDLRHAAMEETSGSMVIQMLRPGDWPAATTGEDDEAVGQGTVVELTGHDGRVTHAMRALADRCAGDSWHGTWIRLAEPPDALASSPDIIDGLVRKGLRLDFAPCHKRGFERAIVGVIFTEEVQQGVYDDAWIFLALTRPASSRTGGSRGDRGPNYRHGRRVQMVRGLRTGPDTHGERIPELRALRDKTVVLVGLGTIGAPIARELAKAQLGELILVDLDFADAGPIVRWDAGLRAVGMGKGAGLQAELAQDYPYTRTMVLNMAVGSTFDGRGPGTKDRFEAALYGADLVIDATAEWNIREVLAAYADEANLPLITAWSIEGYGGVVSVARPGEEACYYCREMWLSPETGAINLPTGPEDPNRIQPTGCADPTFTATSPDLRPIANQAVLIGFGLLTNGHAESYPAYEADTYVYWHRNPDGTLVDPPRWESETIPRHPDCLCHDDT